MWGTLALALIPLSACQGDVRVPGEGASSAGSGADGDDTGDEGGDTGEDTGAMLDIGDPDPLPRVCQVEDLDGPPPACEETAPPETFETPTLEWALPAGPGGAYGRARVIPLVANLTDDNGDGSVDLCDTPDVVLPIEDETGLCSLTIMDGASGAVHTTFEGVGGLAVDCNATPALADIDGDGDIEIVAVVRDSSQSGASGYVVALDASGQDQWVGSDAFELPPTFTWTSSLAIHDLDADGTPEILFGNAVLSSAGDLLWSSDALLFGWSPGSFAVDLDGDGTLEILDGSQIYDLSNDGGTWSPTPGGLTGSAPSPSIFSVAHVADLLPDNPGPEIFITAPDGYLLRTPQGDLPWGQDYLRPLPGDCDPDDDSNWARPAALHDFDGDGEVEIAVSACDTFAIYDVSATGLDLIWTTQVQDLTGTSGATAFDFLSDGTPEPIYSDERTAFVWTAVNSSAPMEWSTSLELERRSETLLEHPIVADVDNDGSAEILVVSSDGSQPPLQVFGTENNDWTQARRIWNQAAYHVTHIREDGSVPAEPPPHWTVLNGFRVNSPIENGGLCTPAG